MTKRELEYDRDVAPAGRRINGTVPNRKYPDGRPVPVAMEDTTFSKRDGSYQNGILGDHGKALGRIENLSVEIVKLLGGTATAASVTSLSGKVEALSTLLNSKSGAATDTATVAAQVIEALGEGFAKEVVSEMGRQLAGKEEGK